MSLAMNDRQFGLKTGDLKVIVQVLRQMATINQALIFGSRAKGNYHDGSDIDIALKGEIDFKTLAELSFILNEETLLPYKIDVVNYQQLLNSQLREHIDRVGIVIYERVLATAATALEFRLDE